MVEQKLETPLELREKVLAHILYDQTGDAQALYRAAEGLIFEDVYSAQLYKAAGEQLANGRTTVDKQLLELSVFLTVPETLQTGVVDMFEDLSSVYDNQPTDAITALVKRAVMISTLQNGIVDASNDLTKGAIPETIIDTLTHAVNIATNIATDANCWNITTKQVIDSLDDIGGAARETVATGVGKIGEITAARKELLIMLGTTNSAKSFFLLNAAVDNVLAGKKVLIVTMEMSREAVLERLVRYAFSVTRKGVCEVLKFSDSSINTVAISAMSAGEVSTERRVRISELITKNIKIIDKEEDAYSPDELRADMRALKDDDFCVDVIVLDYIALMRLPLKQEARRIRLAHCARQCRAIGKAFNAAVISVHQTNRDATTQKGGSLSGAAESFEMNSVADTIFEAKATDRESERGIYRIYILKARDSRKGQVFCCTSALDAAQFCTSAVRDSERITDDIKLTTGI